jgi:hypothetical protein
VRARKSEVTNGAASYLVGLAAFLYAIGAAAASPKTVVELRCRPSLESIAIIVTWVEAHHG